MAESNVECPPRSVPWHQDGLQALEDSYQAVFVIDSAASKHKLGSVLLHDVSEEGVMIPPAEVPGRHHVQVGGQQVGVLRDHRALHSQQQAQAVHWSHLEIDRGTICLTTILII